jgi:hypothetical protein
VEGRMEEGLGGGMGDAWMEVGKRCMGVMDDE